jgi:hypothetical protein
MSNIKPINVNLESLKVSNKKNKTSKASSNAIIKPNILRKELLARIKSHRNNKLKERSTPTSPSSPSSPSSPASPASPTTKIPIKIENKNKINKIDNDKDADDFSQSIDFLKSLSKKKQNNLTQKTNFPLEKTTSISTPIVVIGEQQSQPQPQQQPGMLNKTPSYGCLKNGSLPTFREFKNKTIKKSCGDSNISLIINEVSSIPAINPIILDQEKPPENPEPQENTLTLVNDLVPVNMDNFGSANIVSNAPIQEKSLTKPKTIKYTLGKKDNIVSVLIKNAHTRKNIVDSIARVKETKITDMKKYLKQHNLLKSGSKCPPDIIKKIYEQSFLCGIIKNHNKDNLIENFLNN